MDAEKRTTIPRSHLAKTTWNEKLQRWEEDFPRWNYGANRKGVGKRNPLDGILQRVIGQAKDRLIGKTKRMLQRLKTLIVGRGRGAASKPRGKYLSPPPIVDGDPEYEYPPLWRKQWDRKHAEKFAAKTDPLVHFVHATPPEVHAAFKRRLMD